MNEKNADRQPRKQAATRPNSLRLAVVATALLALAACNTVSGAGKDVSSVGHNVSRGANAAQTGITNATGASSH
ncbi:entericidin A/B family lipoprotein [Acetobacter fallax]|uniref:Entericidin A/B family lipoprotein n=1 Tax=Acetobacter fallax TaxID=1737473 RepID=A0ABX0K7W3_9PROT|nr:entericidin A/B family lipoprotein [Acetobacter fallax]NHO31293.1 entericidin A/B family lipoprotein [Acetobacter fallax]NHO34850.1 entericidin A/B family lipoprotein [Acetobacter fallax]